MKVTRETETPTGYCQCGRPLHYSKQSLKQMVDKIIDGQDPVVTVRVMGVGSFRVQRHFIALHGLPTAKVMEWGFERCFDE